jgi:ABC-type Zn2+ transport system substrate-binding protein/surface adhesin
MKILSTLIIVLTLLSACKEHNHDVDPLLKEALNIQDEAIHLGMDVDTILLAKLAQGAAGQDIAKIQRLKAAYESWKVSMVTIPGLKHDHDHGDAGHEGHDHSGHNHEGHDHSHDHGKEEVATHLTPAEHKKVQEEWKAAIVAIRDSLK